MTKAILAILLLGIVATGCASQNICSKQADGERLPHPADCAKFIACEREEVVRISSCPVGLHFNRYIRECDFKTSARCELSIPLLRAAAPETECACDCSCCDCCSSTPAPPDTPTPPPPDTPTPPPPDTPTPPPTDTPTPPPPGTTGGCENNSTVCSNQLDGTLYPNEGHCNQWITCVGGCAIIMDCPDNLQWNGKFCDHPENISPPCPWPTSPPVTGPSGISCTDQGPCAGAKEGSWFVNSDNSNLYVVCQCECPISMKCPEGLIFNQKLGVCDWPSSPAPNPSPTPEPEPSPGPTPDPNPTPTPEPEPSPGPTPDPNPTPTPEPEPSPGPTPDPNPTPTPEPEPSPGPTPDPNPTPTPEPEPSPGPTPDPNPTPTPGGCENNSTVCSNQLDGTLYPNEGHCNQWITCVGGCAIIMDCPDNLQWNGKFCDHPENISPPCPWPTSPPVTGPSGISCTDQGPCAGAKEGSWFVNSDNSNLYVVCQCECPISMKCPEGLIFNQKLGVCDWPSSPAPNPSPTPEPEPSPGPTPDPNPTPTPEPEPSPGPTPDPNPTPTPEPEPSPGPTPDPNPTPTPEPEPSPGPTPDPNPTPTPDACKNNSTVCSNQLDGTLYPNEGHCNQWITCVGGCSLISECPDNLQWNGKSCDYPENISPTCPWPTSPPVTGPSGISCENQGSCAGAKEGISFVDANNPNLYVVCKCECPIPMKCPDGLVFNQKLGVCDWPTSS